MTILYWTLLILVVGIMGICISILSFQQKEVYKRRDALLEALWLRRNKIPLLIEMFKRANVKVPQEEILALREQLMSPELSFTDTMTQEKSLTDLINGLFRSNENNAQLKSESLFFALQKEFETDLESLRVTINDYNFSLARFRMYCKMPWFKIFEFLFEIRHFSAAAPL